MRITPDGARYLAAGQGLRVPRPFHYRWLAPAICRDEASRWVWLSRCSLALLMVSAWFYAGQGWPGLFVAVVPLGLAGVARINLSYPVLVDLPAMALGLAAAAVAPHSIPAAIMLALVCGMVKETAPIFAAVWAWSPWLLAGLVPVAFRAVQRAGPDVVTGTAAAAVLHPFRTMVAARKTIAPAAYIWPWGICLVGFASHDWRVWAVIVLAYGQCVVATDTVRLYQWAWPTLAVAAAQTVPPAWYVPVLLAHLTSPHAGGGG